MSRLRDGPATVSSLLVGCTSPGPGKGRRLEGAPGIFGFVEYTPKLWRSKPGKPVSSPLTNPQTLAGFNAAQVASAVQAVFTGTPAAGEHSASDASGSVVGPNVVWL